MRGPTVGTSARLFSRAARKARRTGAGTALLQAAEQLAAENGKARLDLTTAKTNLRAQAAYESLGWVRDEVFYAYSKHPNQSETP